MIRWTMVLSKKRDTGVLETLLGISGSRAQALLERLSRDYEHVTGAKDAAILIKENPYRLMDYDFSFQRADFLSRQLGLEPTFLGRHEAANRLLLKEVGSMTLGTLAYKRQQMGLVEQGLLTTGLLEDGDEAWLPDELIAEKEIARFWHALPQPFPDGLTPQEAEALRGFNLNEEQVAAVRMSFTHKASAIIGGAGTGKTHVIAALTYLVQLRNMTTRFLTFTGMSADNIYECLKRFGLLGEGDELPQTIHRTLGMRGDNHFSINVLPAKLVILDEGSTLTNILLSNVLAVLEPDAILVLIGDTGQLPPIGRGRPFESLIRAGLPHTVLTRNYRQQNQPGLTTFAEAIRERNPVPMRGLDNVTAFFGTSATQPLLTRSAEVQAFIRSHTPMPDDWQCICDTNALRMSLNKVFQTLLNPDSPTYAEYSELRHVNHVRQWDKVVFTKNDYDLNIRNGQTGIVIKQTRDELEIAGGGLTKLPRTLVPTHLRLGYAITTYKAQGSGWESIIAATSGPVRHHAHRFYYTAATRPKTRLMWFTPLTEERMWRNILSPDDPFATTLLKRLAH